jgi:hypothetical protein
MFGKETVEQMKVKSITYAGKADVYNMEVEGTHNFVVNGGLIAHNCFDETRYLLMERPLGPQPIKVRSPEAEGPYRGVAI